MEENNQALFEEEFEMPSRPLETLKRMWNSDDIYIEGMQM